MSDLVHIWSDGGWRACDTAADWSGSDISNVTCPECLETTGEPVRLVQGDGQWTAWWGPVGASAATRNDALRALADTLDAADTWAKETTSGG